MSDLLLVRHGETEWSRDGRHTSWTDLPLTVDGAEQARALRPLLSDRKIGPVYASPMQRALRTAELAGLARPQIDADLREWDYGGYEGVTTAEIHRSRPGWYLFSDGVAEGPAAHPGESPEQVGARADRVLRGSRPSSPPRRAMWCWWRMRTSCGCWPPAVLGCRPPPAGSSPSRPGRWACWGPSTTAPR